MAQNKGKVKSVGVPTLNIDRGTHRDSVQRWSFEIVNAMLLGSDNVLMNGKAKISMI